MTTLVRLVATLAALAASAGPGQPAVAVQRDVPFAGPTGTVQRMDVFRRAPRDAPAAPAIVWVHGGGFRTGTRQAMEPYAAWFAQHGWVAATIDYRLRSFAEIRRDGYGAGEPDALQDALTAIAYLRRNATALGIDPQRIVVAGTSAGAVTALNVATGAPGLPPVRAAIAFAGYGHPESLAPGIRRCCSCTVTRTARSPSRARRSCARPRRRRPSAAISSACRGQGITRSWRDPSRTPAARPRGCVAWASADAAAERIRYL